MPNVLESLIVKYNELAERVSYLERQDRLGFTPWTSWTPTVTQSGAVTVTINLARYMIIEKMAIVHARMVATSAGTAGSSIVFGGIPAAVASIGLSDTVLGTGEITDQGTGYYVGFARVVTSTTFALQAHNAGSAIGSNPNFALANTDVIGFNLVYQIA